EPGREEAHHPPGVLGRHEVDGAAHRPAADDGPVGDGPLDIGLRHGLTHAQSHRPQRGGQVLRLDRPEPAHHVGRRPALGPRDPLVPQPKRGDVHGHNLNGRGWPDRRGGRRLGGMSRLRRLVPADLDEAQRLLYDRIVGGPRANGPRPVPLTEPDGSLRGPFNAMLYAPAVGEALQSLGAAVRFGTALSDRVREIAILAVAAHWDSAFERYAHEAIGRVVGLSEDIIAALRAGTEPPLTDPTEQVA